jgi:predicted ATP-grasp superfamily ATP-dependent carboligase
MSTAGPRHRVIVTDGDQRSALAAVRALGRAGHQVLVGAKHDHSLAGASRYAAARRPLPDALREPDAFVDALGATVRAWNADVVMPMTDASMLATLGAVDRLAPAHLPFADIESYRAISNKQALLAAAPRFGIAVPAQRTLCLEHVASVDQLRVPFPVVVKPSRSVGEHNGRRGSFTVAYARDSAELSRVVRGMDPGAFPLLLQQRIVGPGLGIFLLVWNGETVAAFSHRRLREKPPSGGVSVYRESVAADPMLVARSKALLDHFDWRGVAMIEYKIDEATGTPYLMEINGRFWGSLQLAIDAGVDFPNLLISTAVDGEPPPKTSYRAGVRSRWWWGDVDQLLTRLRRSDAALALPPDASPRGRAILEFMRLWWPGDRNEILRFDDPAPFVRETIDWFRRDLFRRKS